MKPQKEPREFKCVVCGITFTKDENKYIGVYDDILYPTEMLCDGHTKYVNEIMDKFQYGGDTLAWRKRGGWVEFIEDNRWALGSKLTGGQFAREARRVCRGGYPRTGQRGVE